MLLKLRPHTTAPTSLQQLGRLAFDISELCGKPLSVLSCKMAFPVPLLPLLQLLDDPSLGITQGINLGLNGC